MLAVIATVLLYPPFEFLVWSQLVASYNCPKKDSLDPDGYGVLDSVSRPGAVLFLAQDVDYFKNPFNMSNFILGPVDQIAYPMSRIRPTELRDSLSAMKINGKFIVISREQASSKACRDSSEIVIAAMNHLTLLEREDIERVLIGLSETGSCIGISARDSVEVAYLYLSSESTTNTSAGLLTTHEAQLVPIDLADGDITRKRTGRLAPTLPVTRFLVDNLSNGYIRCQ
jgi:hypothetical protein